MGALKGKSRGKAEIKKAAMAGGEGFVRRRVGRVG